MNNALFVAWRGGLPEHGQWSPIGKLERVDGFYRFAYTRGAQMLMGFTPFPGMTDLHRVYESEELFPLFANRLLSKSRPEYEAYLTWSGFDPKDPPEPLAILGVTEGIRQTDQLEVFPCPTPDAAGCFVTRFFMHGLRWMPQAAIERASKLRAGERLALIPDPSNPFDAHAIAIRTTDMRDRFMIGYVPRYLAHDTYSLFGGCGAHSIEVSVERLNGSAPTQMRVLCRMNACWPDGFEPCKQEAFQPIVPMPRGTGEIVRA